MLIQPEGWWGSDNGSGLFGKFSDVKFKFIMEVTGTTIFDYTRDKMSVGRATAIGQQVADELVRRARAKDPVIDKDGTMMWVMAITGGKYGKDAWYAFTKPEDYLKLHEMINNMNKKYCILYMLGMLSLTSCVTDEGNDDIQAINEAKIEGIDDSYYKVAEIETLEIPVQVSGTLSGDDMSRYDLSGSCVKVILVTVFMSIRLSVAIKTWYIRLRILSQALTTFTLEPLIKTRS